MSVRWSRKKEEKLGDKGATFHVYWQDWECHTFRDSIETSGSRASSVSKPKHDHRRERLRKFETLRVRCAVLFVCYCTWLDSKVICSGFFE